MITPDNIEHSPVANQLQDRISELERRVAELQHELDHKTMLVRTWESMYGALRLQDSTGRKFTAKEEVDEETERRVRKHYGQERKKETGKENPAV